MWEDVPTRYVEVGGAEVAWKAVGDHPLDLLYFAGVGGQVDRFFDDLEYLSWISALTGFSRLIGFDHRGIGASDRPEGESELHAEDWADDALAVLDAAGSEKAAVFANLDGGAVALLLAHRHPERVSALILANAWARFLVDDDYPIGRSSGALEGAVRGIENLWGSDRMSELIDPASAGDAQAARSKARQLRSSATPRAAAAQLRHTLERDDRALLAELRVPTLVLHTAGNPLAPPALGRHLADHIEGAQFVEVRGEGIGFNHQNSSYVLDVVTEFLTGAPLGVDLNRVVTTILFTDIVGSTERIVEVGDREWRATLDAHDRIVRTELEQHGGREVNTTGDGFCAAFDDPVDAVRCALAIRNAVRPLGVEVRAGVHVGECERRRGDLAGLAVHIASRVGSVGAAGEVLVTDDVVARLTGSPVRLDPWGEVELRGVPGRWPLHSASAAVG